MPLAPGEISVGFGLAGAPGVDTTEWPDRIGGRPATIEVERPGACKDSGGDLTIAVKIARAYPSNNWVDVHACLRGPETLANEVLFRTMLASIEVA